MPAPLDTVTVLLAAEISNPSALPVNPPNSVLPSTLPVKSYPAKNPTATLLLAPLPIVYNALSPMATLLLPAVDVYKVLAPTAMLLVPTTEVVNALMPTSAIAAAKGVDPNKFAAFQAQQQPVKECNYTMENHYCPVHGLAECSDGIYESQVARIKLLSLLK